MKRDCNYNPTINVTRMPFDGYFGETVNTIAYIEAFIDDDCSGIDIPATILLETVQAEGEIKQASTTWLRDLTALAKKYNILLIVDDIQVGCGRTGSFLVLKALVLNLILSVYQNQSVDMDCQWRWFYINRK